MPTNSRTKQHLLALSPSALPGQYRILSYHIPLCSSHNRLEAALIFFSPKPFSMLLHICNASRNPTSQATAPSSFKAFLPPSPFNLLIKMEPASSSNPVMMQCYTEKAQWGYPSIIHQIFSEFIF
ncbi:hypothetical protein KIL84_015272 [Mauremys mutica]|uniref:Uncharacterized protein n=1 Tax=Mauremys mutica TaxID=74926 RepID=A0A9D3WS35_9SAUR|nr:hypothetical protein KIL84_015272 [Mauremys mutica]